MSASPRHTTVKVRGFDCDLYGHVNNARYLEYLEAARWDLVEDAIDLEAWHERGWHFVVVNVNVDYRAAATLGDILHVSAARGELGRTSSRIVQRIVRERDGAVVVDATITFVVVDRATGRPLPLKGALREELESIAGHDPGDAVGANESERNEPERNGDAQS